MKVLQSNVLRAMMSGIIFAWEFLIFYEYTIQLIHYACIVIRKLVVMPNKINVAFPGTNWFLYNLNIKIHFIYFLLQKNLNVTSTSVMICTVLVIIWNSTMKNTLNGRGTFLSHIMWLTRHKHTFKNKISWRKKFQVSWVTRNATFYFFGLIIPRCISIPSLVLFRG